MLRDAGAGETRKRCFCPTEQERDFPRRLLAKYNRALRRYVGVIEFRRARWSRWPLAQARPGGAGWETLRYEPPFVHRGIRVRSLRAPRDPPLSWAKL